MIIRSLWAENLLKYRQVALQNLPARGTILLTGDNEAGKSSLLEILCFAIFGQSAPSSPARASEPVRLLRWGADAGSSRIDLLLANHDTCQITRHIDRHGKQRAEVIRRGQDPASKPFTLRGPAAVAQLLPDLLGFGYPEFVQVLYRSRRYADASWPIIDTFNLLSGVEPVTGAATELAALLATDRHIIAAGESRLRELDDRRRQLDLHADLLDQLERQDAEAEQKRLTCRREIDRWLDFTGQLDRASEGIDRAVAPILSVTTDASLATWRHLTRQLATAIQTLEEVCRSHHVEMDSPPGFAITQWWRDLTQRLAGLEAVLQAADDHRHRLLAWLGEGPEVAGDETFGTELTLAEERKTLEAQRTDRYLRMRRHAIAAWVALGLALAGWLLWVILRLQSGGWGLFAGGSWTKATWAAIFGWVAALGVAGVLVSRHRTQNDLHTGEWEAAQLEDRETIARQQVPALSQLHERPLTEQVAALNRLYNPSWAASLAEWCEGDGFLLMNSSSLATCTAQLHQARELFREERDLIEGEVAEQIQLAETLYEQHRLTLESLHQHQQQERDRRDQERQILEESRLLVGVLMKKRREERIHTLAIQLLTDTAQTLADRFRQQVERLLAAIVPLFTEDHYQHVRIDEGSAIQVFSATKNHFVHWEELSSGVQHQLLLALRVALALALTSKAGSAPQCLILDEPFLFFDRGRRRTSFAALSRTTPEIAQVWVVDRQPDPTDRPIEEGCLTVECRPETDTLIMTGTTTDAQ